MALCLKAELDHVKRAAFLHSNPCPMNPSSGNSSPAIPATWAWHFEQLQRLRDRLLLDCSEQAAEAAVPVESHSMDQADSATDEFDHDRAFSLLSSEQNALYEVEAALQRILEGSYGKCEECGEPIPAARLRAIPWARYTKAVEERLEQQGQVPGCKLPGVKSLQGASVVGLAQADEPEAEELLTREVTRQRREADLKAIESGKDVAKEATEEV